MADNPLSLTSAMGIFYEEKLPILRDFIRVFFPNMFTTKQNQIQVDRFLRGNKRAFYRPADGSSKVLAFTNGTGTFYEPPHIGVKTNISEDLTKQVTVGVNAMSSVDEHTAKKYAMIQNQHAGDIMAEVVLQAVNVLFAGTFNAVTEGGQVCGVYDFGRAAANDITYDVSAKGGFQWLKELYDLLKIKRCPSMNLVCLAGSSFITAMEEDEDFQAYVNQQWYQTTDGLEAGRPYGNSEILRTVCKIKIPGTSHKVTIISFDETYVNGSGVETPFIADDEAMMTTLNTQRTSAYAGIFIANQAEGTGATFEGEIITDRFVNKDPDGLVLRTQTRPLMIPGNIDHTARVTGSNF